MCPRGDTEYFLEVERVLVDQQLKAAQERAVGLKWRADGQRDARAAKRAVAMSNMLLSVRQRLEKL